MRFNLNKRKYSNVKINGFDSIAEMNDFNTLLLLQRANKISNLTRQYKVVLNKDLRVTYTCDFAFIENDLLVIWDTKGFKTDTFRVKRAWVLDKYKNFKFVTHYKSKQKQEIHNGVGNLDLKEMFLNSILEKVL